MAAQLDGFYFAEGDRVRQVSTVMPGFSGGEIAIAADDGSKLYRFNTRGQHLSTVSTLTGATLYTMGYDASNRLVTITDGDGNVTTIQRDTAGNATAVVGPFGQTTTLTTNADGYLASMTDPTGQTTSFTYTGTGLLTSMTDAKGSTYQYSFDPAGRLISASDPAGGSTTLSRTGSGGLHTVTRATGEGRITTYVSEQLPIGGSRQVNTFPTGLQNEVTEHSDGSTTMALGDGTTSARQAGPDPRFSMQSPLSTSASITTPGGLIRTMTHGRTVTLSDPSNPLSLLSQTDTLSVNGRSYASTFDATTRRHTSTSPVGRLSTVDVDTLGRVVAQQVPGLAPVAFLYDAHGRLTTVTEGSGADTRTSIIAYNPAGLVDSVTDPLSRSVSFNYDLAGRVTQQTLPGGRVVQFGYDPNGNMTSITPPGRPSHVFSYTPVDLAGSYTPPVVPGSGTTSTIFTYNKDRQLTEVSRPDGKMVQLSYDTAGRPSSITLPRGAVTSSYDAGTGQLSTLTSPDGVTLTYAHDGGLVTSTSWSGSIVGTVGRTYDNNLRIASRSVNGGQTVSFTYDNDGLLTQAGQLAIDRSPTTGFVSGTTLGGLITSKSYTSFGELAAVDVTHGTTGLYATSYMRDALGRITQLDEIVDGVSQGHVYSYDAAGRLDTVSVDGVVVADYDYDANGNRTQVSSDVGLTLTASYDAQDRLLTYGTNGYTYTANGELVSRTTTTGTTTYVYDVLGNLLSATLEDGTSIEYVIDGQSRRVGKKVNGVLVQGWLYKDRLNPVAELDGAGTVVSRFVYGTKPHVPDYMEKGGVTYRILSDHLGCVRLVVDASTGAVAQWLDYDEFGVVLQDTAPGFQPFGFGGGIYDYQTKLVRFGARDYDAEVGRWTRREPNLIAGTGINVYEYVGSDPVNLIDSSGFVINFDSYDTFSKYIGDLVDIMSTPKGWDLVNQLEMSDTEYLIRDCPGKDSEVFPKTDPPTSVCIDSTQHPMIETDKGQQRMSTTRALAHELGHLGAGRCAEGGSDSMGITNEYENQIMNRLEGFNRTKYFHEPVLTPPLGPGTRGLKGYD